MELTDVKNKIIKILSIKEVEEIPTVLMGFIITDNKEVYKNYMDEIGELDTDWVQSVYQYYLADRKEKKQDYTPKTIAKLMGKIALMGEPEEIIDLCAGSGALTIQTWNIENKTKFECIEIDENVLPILLFNLAVRNIEAIVYQKDILQDEIYNIYKIEKGDDFGKVVLNENSN